MVQTARRHAPQSYTELAVAAGLGATLASGIIVGLASTITVWQNGLHLSGSQVGVISGMMSFSIAFGSIVGGRLSDYVGRTLFFNWINLIYALGAALCVFAADFNALMAGIIIAGIASGAEVPVAITVLSYDAPDSATGSQLVSFSQVFWQAGMFLAYSAAFAVSSIPGALGGRIVFGLFALLALVITAWRVLSPSLRAVHAYADDRHRVETVQSSQEKISVRSVLLGERKKVLLGFLAAITLYYVMWNLLANTWGQFQTYMFTQAGSSQSLATALGIGLNLVTLVLNIVFAALAGGRWRNTAFYCGLVFTLIALVIMAVQGSNFWIVVCATALLYAGIALAGEAIYKVWTQESFPLTIRASVQGYINGFSRLICGIFAFVTPALVAPAVMTYTMWGFAGVVIVEAVAGCVMIALQKRHGTDAQRRTNG
ncbi:MFS transporter [Alloscardovia omnicolens]|uniref:MFS transporter n=1 Tax=Alloscardovia omnicolens TaxID=419015 RepID=UPI003A7929BC